jgi:ornithine cyclodeaminase
MTLHIIDAQCVRACLNYSTCIALMREAMKTLSRGDSVSMPRQILPLLPGQAFGVMQGALARGQVFGAKVISVFAENFAKGQPGHQGVITLFDPQTGAPLALVHAGEITAIRTAAASAAATDVLALPHASRLAVLGYGEQAHGHVLAIATVRRLESIYVWGRDAARRQHFASSIQQQTGIQCVPADSVQEAAASADIICTTTAASEPILEGAWVRPGTHINVVGSSRAGPAEVDIDLVAMSRFIADSRANVLSQGTEFLNAKAAGRVDDSHVVAEIGEVFAGGQPGRRRADEITVYKSLGHIVQDLASAWHVYQTARQRGLGAAAAF